MERKHRINRTQPSEHKNQKSLPTSLVLILIAATAAVGFVAGAQRDHIWAVIGPVFGISVYVDDLDVSSLQATYKELKANYDGTLDDQTLIEGANKGLVSAAGDAYTLYMNRSETTQFESDLSGAIGGGVGAEIGQRSDKITIIRVLKDNPAASAGVNAGDVITAINDTSTVDLNVEQAVSQIRGAVGTTVKLTVMRGSEEKIFTITRKMITNPSVEGTVSGTLGILTISRFDDQAGSLARAAANEFKNKGVKAVILDLRGNGGGYVSAAQTVAGLWLDNKVVVSEQKNGVVVEQFRSGKDPILAGIPTVVLVNGGSASASEIVAGALQDYSVAKLVGEKTFGKGTVQKIIKLADGAQLKVTTARWFTPNGQNITTSGIQPTQTVGLDQADSNAGRDPQLDAAKALLGL